MRLVRPDFMKRLWFQLAVSYTLLAFCAMTLLMVLLYGIDDYHDFHAAVSPAVVEAEVAGENLTAAQAIQSGSDLWWGRLEASLSNRLINLQYGSGTSIYRITSSSEPKLFWRVTAPDGRLLRASAGPMPAEAMRAFAVRRPDEGPLAAKAENGSILVDLPVLDADGAALGRLQVVFIARFDFRIEATSILNFLLYTWIYVLLLSMPIGVASGLVASRYVTRQLHKMNEVTERWRQGQFDARIALPNDDVLVRHSQHLNDMAQDLEMSLSLRQSLAVSEERNRVARELHDTVKQKLFALGLQLAAAKAKPGAGDASENILEAEAITREAQHDLMEIITQLHPPGPGEGALSERIELVAEDFRRRFDVAVDVDAREPMEMDAHVEHHVLRIVQEALMNAVRHGKALCIGITGRMAEGRATLTIADDGQGFDPSVRTGGFGIVSMRDRVRDLPGGSFDLKSAPGAGATITLSWKVEP